MSSREICVSHLTQILGGISLSNGYSLDLGSSVRRELVTMESLDDSDLDTLIVEDNGEGDAESLQNKTGNETAITFKVLVIGYVKKKDGDPSVTTAINRLDNALTKVVGQEANQRVANIWVSARPSPLLGRSGSELGDYGWFIRPIEITYQCLTSEGF